MLVIVSTSICTSAWLYVGFWSYVYWTDRMNPDKKDSWNWNEMKGGIQFSVLGPLAYYAGKAVYKDYMKNN